MYRLALKDAADANAAFDTTDSDGNTHDLRTDLAYTDGNWHVLTGWFSQTETPDKRIFVDGRQVVPDPETAPPPVHGGRALGSGTTRFGFIGVGSEAAVEDGATGPAFFFAGDLAEVIVFHRALDDDERAALDRYFAHRYAC